MHVMATKKALLILRRPSNPSRKIANFTGELWTKACSNYTKYYPSLEVFVEPDDNEDVLFLT